MEEIMRRLVRHGAVLSALILLSASPSWAESQHDRAKTAIAEAQAKIDAAARLERQAKCPS
jgi:hypothetical protein